MRAEFLGKDSYENNLALGQKRAVAVKQVMNVLGASDKQIETVSFGKENPRRLVTMKHRGQKTVEQTLCIQMSNKRVKGV